MTQREKLSEALAWAAAWKVAAKFEKQAADARTMQMDAKDRIINDLLKKNNVQQDRIAAMLAKVNEARDHIVQLDFDDEVLLRAKERLNAIEKVGLGK